MATDVVQKAITANAVENGAAVVRTNKLTNYQAVNPEILADTNLTRTENKLDGRFDDTNYYSN